MFCKEVLGFAQITLIQRWRQELMLYLYYDKRGNWLLNNTKPYNLCHKWLKNFCLWVPNKSRIVSALGQYKGLATSQSSHSVMAPWQRRSHPFYSCQSPQSYQQMFSYAYSKWHQVTVKIAQNTLEMPLFIKNGLQNIWLTHFCTFRAPWKTW